MTASPPHAPTPSGPTVTPSDERRTVASVAPGKSGTISVVTLACGHRHLWKTRTILPKVGSTLWCSGCYSYGDSPKNTKALRRNARAAITTPDTEERPNG